jgi:hypothetical protein
MKKSMNHSIIIKTIAGFFFVNALTNVVNLLTYYDTTAGYPLLASEKIPEFLIKLSGIMSNDPITHGIIVALPFYDELVIYAKAIFTIFILFCAAYLLLKRHTFGLWLAVSLCIAGLLFTLGKSPSDYIANIAGGIATFGIMSEWTIVGILFLLTLFTPIYLLTHRKLFKTK